MIYFEREEDGFIIRDAVRDDVQVIADSIREEDANEAVASGHDTPFDALDSGFSRSSVTITIERKGVPVAMLGVIPDCLLGSRANLWCLGAHGLGDMKKTMVKMTPRVLQFFLSRYGTLYSIVDSRYEKALRWLRRVGGTLSEPFLYGPQGLTFFRFEISTVGGKFTTKGAR